jgi:hypothetical protein
LRYSDRWRFDENGHRKLTLREIWVRIQYLPNDSAIVIEGNDGAPRWGDMEYLTADLFRGLTGSVHPARPKPRKVSPKTAQHERNKRRIQKQFQQRREAIERGEIT